MDFSKVTLSGIMALAAVVLLVLFGIFFGCTHTLWYDALHDDQRTTFWADFFVAYGTIALALTTWGSVYETQKVIVGEDRRFRQSRIPVVVVSDVKFKTQTNWAEVTIQFTNKGDGPALDVRATVSSTIDLIARDITTGERFSMNASWDDVFVTSYLASKDPAKITFNSNAFERNGNFQQHTINTIRLTYTDAFNESYSTTYHDFAKDLTKFAHEKPPSVT